MGLIFLTSSAVNLSGFGEDLGARMHQMAKTLAATELGTAAAFIANNQPLVLTIVFVFMGITGSLQLFNHRLAHLAAIGQIIMMIGFIAFLHLDFPLVIGDGLLILALACVLVHRSHIGKHNIGKHYENA